MLPPHEASNRAEKDLGVLNYFFQNTVNVFLTTVALELERTGIRTEESPTIPHEIVVMVGVTGDLEGEVCLCMNEDFAIKVIQAMGYGGDEFDDLAESAMCEMCNMVTGTSLMEAQKLGFETDLLPPTVLTGKDVRLTVPEIPAIIVDYQSAYGPIMCCVCLAEPGGIDLLPASRPTPISTTITGVITAQDMLKDVQKLFAENIEKAIRVCRHIVELDFAIAKKVAGLCTLQGAKLLEAGQANTAIELLLVSLTYDKLDVQTNLTLGHAYRVTADYDKARRHYLQAVGADPELGEGYFFLGEAFEAMGNHERAARAFGLAADKGYGEARERLIRAEADRTESTEAPAACVLGRAVVADDAILARTMIKDALEAVGLEVVGLAGNGYEALELCNKHHPQLVTLDVNMPGLGGAEALRAIRREMPGVKAIIISVMARDEQKKFPAEPGMTTILSKPFKKSELAQALRDLKLLS